MFPRRAVSPNAFLIFGTTERRAQHECLTVSGRGYSRFAAGTFLIAQLVFRAADSTGNEYALDDRSFCGHTR